MLVVKAADQEPRNCWGRLVSEVGVPTAAADGGATDVVLTIGGASQFVVAVAAHEVPLVTKIMVQDGPRRSVALGNSPDCL